MAVQTTIGRIVISTLEGSDTISGSRTIINDNFKLLAESINVFQNFLNPEEKKIEKIETLSIQKGLNPINDVLISTNGSISVGGSVNINSNVSANNAKITQSLTIEKGSIDVNASDSTSNFNGALALGGSLILKDFGNQFVNASDKQTFTTNNWSNLVLDETNNIIGGAISLVGANSIVLDFSSWSSSIDPRYFINKVKFNTQDIPIGQKVLVLVLVGSNINQEFTIMKDTIKTFNDLNNGIKFNKSYQIIELIFDGTNWVLLNYTPGVELD